MAKPTITGVGRGERLKVLWPGCGFGPSGPREDRAEVLPMMALLFPDAMVKALISAIDLTSTAACPDVLIDQLDQLAYIEEILVAAAIADGRDAQRRASAPPAAVLGVRVAEKVQRAA
jgi:hypothetical protein